MGLQPMTRRDEKTSGRAVPMVRVFLLSPEDVAKERTLARQLIDSELPKIPTLRGRLALEMIAWLSSSIRRARGAVTVSAPNERVTSRSQWPLRWSLAPSQARS
jgi:hypothetical protein